MVVDYRIRACDVLKHRVRPLLIAISAIIILFNVAMLRDVLAENAQSHLAAPDIRLSPSSLFISQGCANKAGSDQPRQTFASPFMPVKGLIDGDGTLLEFNESALDSLAILPKVVLSNFPLSTTRQVDLILDRFTIFDASTQFVEGTINGDVLATAPDVILLSGTISGDSNSTVFLGLSKDIVSGYMTSGDRTFVVAESSSRGQREIAVYDLESVDFDNSAPWECGGAIELPNDVDRTSQNASPAAAGLEICRVAADGDYELYQKFGNVNTAQAYLVELLGAATVFYRRDFGAILWANYVRVWSTSADPYNSGGNSSAALVEFRNYWNTNMSGVQRNIAHKFSGTRGGGIAYLDVLCYQQAAYGVSCINGSFPFPLVSGNSTWDLIVTAHEIGHNFGSPHTHCYNPPIDMCYGSEGGCYSGSVVCTRGTIMSYCHTCAGLSNVDLIFGQRVIDFVVPIIQSSPCLLQSTASFTVFNDGDANLDVSNIVSNCPELSVLSPSFMVAPGQSREIDLYVNWPQISTQKSCQLTVTSNDPDENPTTLEVTIAPTISLSAPSNVNCTPNCGTISLSWSAVPGATSYCVNRDNVATVCGIVGTSWTDPNPGTANHCYKVKATLGDCESPYSAVKCCTALSDCGWQATIHAEGQVVGSARHSSDVVIGIGEVDDTDPALTPPSQYTVWTSLWRESDGPFYRDARLEGACAYDWQLEVDPHGNVPPSSQRCAILQWDCANLYPGGLWQLIRSDGDAAIVVSDMRATQQYQVCGTGSIDFIIRFSPSSDFACGDCDGSGSVTIGDAVCLINYVFAGGAAPHGPYCGSVDCDLAMNLNLTDAVLLINFMFAGGPAPCAGCQ